MFRETGEDVYISVNGAAQDAAVRLDRSSLEIEDTYISLANQRTVTISNRSDVTAHFRWTRFATSADEERQKLSYVATLESFLNNNNFSKPHNCHMFVICVLILLLRGVNSPNYTERMTA